MANDTLSIGNQKIRLIDNGDGTFSLSVSENPVAAQVGAANIATNQVALSVTAGTLVAARATRRSVMIKNLDPSIKVYIGPATVTVANGMELKGGESVSVDWVGLIQGIAASGTPTVAYMETYD